MAGTADGIDEARLLIDNNQISSLQWTIFAVCFLMNAVDGMDVLIISYAAPMLGSPHGSFWIRPRILPGSRPIRADRIHDTGRLPVFMQ